MNVSTTYNFQTYKPPAVEESRLLMLPSALQLKIALLTKESISHLRQTCKKLNWTLQTNFVKARYRYCADKRSPSICAQTHKFIIDKGGELLNRETAEKLINDFSNHAEKLVFPIFPSPSAYTSLKKVKFYLTQFDREHLLWIFALSRCFTSYEVTIKLKSETHFLKNLSELGKAVNVDLKKCQKITDSKWQYTLGKVNRLKSLGLVEAAEQKFDFSISRLAKSQNLLHLKSLRISPPGLPSHELRDLICSCTQLKKLDLIDCNFKTGGVFDVVELTQLTSLRLQFTSDRNSISEDDPYLFQVPMTSLAKLINRNRHLQFIGLENVQLVRSTEDNGKSDHLNLQNLKKLRVVVGEIYHFMPFLFEAKNLEEVDLKEIRWGGTPILPAVPYNCWPKLRSLSLTDVCLEGLNDENTRSLIGRGENLTKIDFEHGHFSHAAFDGAQLDKLRHLSLGTGIFGENYGRCMTASQWIDLLRRCPTLEKLSMKIGYPWTNGLGFEDLGNLEGSLRNLKSLAIDTDLDIDDLQLHQIARQSKKLETISLGHNGKITGAAFVNLVIDCPMLKEIYLPAFFGLNEEDVDSARLHAVQSGRNLTIATRP